MNQPHQHGPQCKHGHGGHGQGKGHGHGNGGHGGHGHSDISPKEYFQKIKEMKQKNPQFYWMQILSGNYFNKFCQQKGFDMIRSLNCQVIIMLVAQAQMMFNCQWLPLRFRPFISGMFFPLVFLLFFNFNVIFGIVSPDFTFLHLFSYLTIIFYIATALRQAGTLNSVKNSKKSQQVTKQRPYLQNPSANCSQCKILKVFRSFHCPICKVCISKFSRHSLAFGSCIGAKNQILALGFFICLTIAQAFTLIQFFQLTNYGVITNIMFYTLNFYILWISFVQSATLFVMNFYFGITQHQTRAWMMTQYLLKVPQRQFVNSVGKGLINNLTQSLYSLFKISGYESENKKKNQNPMQQQIPISGNSQFQKIDPNKKYLINWSKAFFYLTPQIPTHPSRQRIIEIMTRDQPKMLEMYKLQKQFKQQVLKQSQGQGLNDFQIQQKVAMKMQQHMMKNSQSMGSPMAPMAPPSLDQQKVIQIQMMTHMMNQLSEKQPQIAQRIKSLLQSLKEDKISPMQVGMSMRQIQQDLMKKQMQIAMKQRQAQVERQKAKEQAQKTHQSLNEDEQARLKKQQVEIADEDL